jgi:hypothetical protein
MQTSHRNASLLLVIVGLVLFLAAPVRASTFDRAIEHCRDTVGRRIVQACLDAQGKGPTFEFCRLEAAPRVRACVHDAMADGGTSLQRAIEHCRQKVGRPIVQGCMREQGKGAAFEGCRAHASPSVRVCVRRTMLAVYGRAHVDQAIEHCRQTVGRPIVRACMGGSRRHHGADLQACRARASPKVRACVQNRLRAT